MAQDWAKEAAFHQILDWSDVDGHQPLIFEEGAFDVVICRAHNQIVLAIPEMTLVAKYAVVVLGLDALFPAVSVAFETEWPDCAFMARPISRRPPEIVLFVLR